MPSDADLSIRTVLQLRYFDRTVEWYRTPGAVDAIVDAIAKRSFFAELALAGPDDGLKKSAGLDQAKRLLAGHGAEVLKMQDVPDEKRKLLVRIEPSPGSMQLQVWVSGPALRRLALTLLDEITTLAADVRALVGDAGGLQFGYAYPLNDRSGEFVYPRPRPPRTHPSLQLHAVLELIDLAFHRSKHELATAEGAERLAKSALPPFVTKVERGGLLAFRFADDVCDRAQLERGAAAHEEWIGTNLRTAIDGDYNELGDALEERGKVEERKPLTFYAPADKIGYKTVVVFPDGSVDESAWAEAKRVLDAGKLPDGKIVKKVKLVVPLRELTFRVAARARQEGFAGVLYPSDDGEFWDPDPPGTWAGPPRAEA